jgi:hypothetical protein
MAGGKVVTRDQLGACIKLGEEGLYAVLLVETDKTPIPGSILFVDEGHTKLIMVQPDGTAIDLFEIHRLAEDCVRNWHKGDTLPQFVGDFKRLTGAQRPQA